MFACLVLFIPDEWRQWVMPNLLGFVASTMLATATSGLFPEALEHILILEAGITLLVGLALFFILEWMQTCKEWRTNGGCDGVGERWSVVARSQIQTNIRLSICGRSAHLLAEIEGHLIGILYCRVVSPCRMVYMCAFVMSVRQQWWRHGVGTSLIQCLLDWPRVHPQIRKVIMRALVGNVRTLALHRKLGVVVEGRCAQAIKAADERFVDEYEMSQFVKLA